MSGTSHRRDRQRGGGAAAAVETVEVLLDWIPDERECITTYPAGIAVDNREHRVGRDRGIHGGSAGAEGLDAGGRCQGVRRDHHATRRCDGGHHHDRTRLRVV